MFSRFDVSMLVPGLPCDGSSLAKTSLGGSESAGIYLAKALARLGARVNVFCNTRSASVDEEGVAYSPSDEWSRHVRNTPHCIAQRVPEAFSQATNSRLNILWCHDLAMGRQKSAFTAALWNVDRVIVLSQYMKRQYEEVYAVDPNLLHCSRNGVDLGLFQLLAPEALARDRKKLIFAARPERGLDVLLRRIMPKLLAADPELRLFIAGYENNYDEWRTFYAQCGADALALGDRVVSVGALGKRDLYRLYASAGVYVYPTPSPMLSIFREVSCITAMECQAAGLPIVTTALGALPETIAPGAGTLIKTGLRDEEYDTEFVQAVLRLTRDDDVWSNASALGKEHAQGLDWATVAEEWLSEFERLIRAGNESPERLIRYFWRTSDIAPAKHLLEKSHEQPRQLSDKSRASVEALLAPWAFMDRPNGYRLQYETIGESHSEQVYDAHEELRFAHLEDWLAQRQDHIHGILDYGCAHGAYAVGLTQRLKHVAIHGVDIDRFSIDMATRAAQRLGVADRTTFSVWTHDSPESLPLTLGGAGFDLVLIQEVLEHVPEPWAVLAAIEERVCKGTKVYITVPFGPWEFTSYRTYPHRCHIWHFDAHDLRDMIGAKPDFEIAAVHAGNNPLTGQAQGWWIASYSTDGTDVPKIDMARHLWLQRPRQTVSVALIVGAHAEENLHWTLRSVQDVADEIVIADCGMGPEALRIASQYDALIVPGVDPRREGFDAARNVALMACSGDWCLWIDSDERLVGSEVAEKYLRESVFHGYAIGQHNFACDDSSSTDYPLRLFRRAERNGRTLRFWGAIHEHPEFALNAGAGPTIALPDVQIAHVGYLNEKSRRERFLRNWPLLQLDQKLNPDRLIQKYFVMRDNMHLVRYSLAANGGVVDESIEQKCRATVALYQKYFLGQDGSRHSLEYYSEALTVLGEGFDTAIQLDAAKDKAAAGGVKRYRFASARDFCIELNRVGTEKAKQFDSPTW